MPRQCELNRKATPRHGGPTARQADWRRTLNHFDQVETQGDELQVGDPAFRRSLMAAQEAAALTVWRFGILPLFTKRELDAIRLGLETDDPNMIQHGFADPRPYRAGAWPWTSPRPSNVTLPCRSACVIGFAGWRSGQGLETVGEVEAFVARMCRRADRRLGLPSAVARYFDPWYGEGLAARVTRVLLAEVRRELAARGVR